MTTGEASLEQGMRFLGIDAKPEYARIGKRRLTDYASL